MGHPDQSEWEDEAKEREWYDGLKQVEIDSTVEGYFGAGSAPFAQTPPATPVQEMLAQFPLFRFSLYTELEKRAVIKAGHDALEALDRTQGATASAVEGAHLEDAYGRFFLWLCAADEIGRTMRDAKQCFAPRLQKEIVRLMIPLEDLRVPFAKQELPTRGKVGRKVALQAECSVVGLGSSPADLLFQVHTTTHSARALMEDFEAVFASITSADVVADLRDTQIRRATQPNIEDAN